MRSGRVAIVGRTNVGKSTFLNAALGQPLAIVSRLPQTTRDDLLGIVRREGSEIAFVDTPGMHRPKSELGRRMNATALSSLKSDDAVLLMTDVSAFSRRPRKSFLPDSDLLEPDDRRLIQVLPKDVPCVLVVNKVDLMHDKSRLLPLMQAFTDAFPFAAVIPVSVLNGDGVDIVLTEIEKLLPESEAHFDDDALTDRPLTFFAREYIREQVMQQTDAEVPHAVAVTIERFEQREKLCVINATIHVERDGQGSILVGKGGQTIKALGIAARVRLEELIGCQVHLELFVRVSERWKDTPRRLSELGYTETRGRSLENLLPTAPEKASPHRSKKPKSDEQRKNKPAGKKPRGPKRDAPRTGARSQTGKPRTGARSQTGKPRTGARQETGKSRAGTRPRTGKKT
jgi:GTPase